MDLFEWLEQKGFINQNDDFIKWNKNDEVIEDSIEEWAKENCEQYDIDSDDVFNSPGLDIYCPLDIIIIPHYRKICNSANYTKFKQKICAILPLDKTTRHDPWRAANYITFCFSCQVKIL